MTQKSEILKAFREHNNILTLGTMLNYSWGYTARNRISELRKEGYNIKCIKGETPSKNAYELVPEQGQQDRQYR